jgi:hypothetical protein
MGNEKLRKKAAKAGGLSYNVLERFAVLLSDLRD